MYVSTSKNIIKPVQRFVQKKIKKISMVNYFGTGPRF